MKNLENIRTYKIGDYYDDGKKQGVVFDVSADGKHGKIVSFTESDDKLSWYPEGFEKTLLVGAEDRFNGLNNMAKVKSIRGWRKRFPAFAWCADLGKDWYLPAIEELALFGLNDEIRNVINQTLVDKGGNVIQDEDDGWFHPYWSSTERDLNTVWCVSVIDNKVIGISKCVNFGYARAVSIF